MKLNQIIAIEAGVKKRHTADISALHQTLQKSALFNGSLNTFTPLNEDGPKLPEQRVHMQQNALALVKQAEASLVDLWDTVGTKDAGNTTAVGTVTVDGIELAKDVPITHLLFLENQLTDIMTFVKKLPTLDPSKAWVYTETKDTWETEYPEIRLKTKKTTQSLLKVAPSEFGPGQAELVTVDVQEGQYKIQEMSSAFPAARVRTLIERVVNVQNAVKFAREQANSLEIERKKLSSNILSYIFKD